MSEIHHKNYNADLKKMKRLSTELNLKRKALKLKSEQSKKQARKRSLPANIDYFRREDVEEKTNKNAQF